MSVLRHIIYAALGGWLAFAPAIAYADTAEESRVKAAILYNLIRFSHWQDKTVSGPDTPDFKVCSLATSEMQTAMETFNGKPVHARKVTLYHVKKDEPVSSDCEVLFTSKTYVTKDFNLKDLHAAGILTVSDDIGFADRDNGGCFSIHRDDSKIRFSINLQAMKDANITPSSKILSLAAHVRRR